MYPTARWFSPLPSGSESSSATIESCSESWLVAPGEPFGCISKSTLTAMISIARVESERCFGPLVSDKSRRPPENLLVTAGVAIELRCVWGHRGGLDPGPESMVCSAELYLG